METRLRAAVTSRIDPTPEDDHPDVAAAAQAAISICECLVIALIERGVIDREEMRGTLEDARNAHAFAGGTREERRINERAADMISRIIESVSAA